MMNTYYFEGRARQRGAIGIFHAFTDTVQANTRHDAEMDLHNRWEHIRIEKCVETKGEVA